MLVKDFLEFAEQVRQSSEKDQSVLDLKLNFYDGSESWDIDKLEITMPDPETEEPGYVVFELKTSIDIETEEPGYVVFELKTSIDIETENQDDL
ncbi:MAG: hypothetical protein AN483_07045 [Aphanizomenon flos-aquae MDT14a]|jgi:hypothetical protein|nr:MAG: hypothetical protein AN483_07045 [Aphanizomenon flos-aquae MDT14a]